MGNRDNLLEQTINGGLKRYRDELLETLKAAAAWRPLRPEDIQRIFNDRDDEPTQGD